MKRGVIELPLHWIMVIIIGVALLIFFGQAGWKLSDVSKDVNDRLLVLEFEKIFLNAASNTKTSSYVDLPLDGKVVEFKGDRFYIKEGSKLIASGKLNQFVFGNKIERGRVRIWSETFELPFKVANFVFVDDGRGFEIVDYVGDLGSKIQSELENKDFNVNGEKRIKFVKGDNDCLDDSDADLIVYYVEDEIIEDAIIYGTVCFYENGEKKGEKEFVTREMIYGAIFSNFETYDTLYGRAIGRLIDVDNIYANIDDRCRVKIPFGEMNNLDDIVDIIKKAKEIEEKNKERIRSGCDYAY